MVVLFLLITSCSDLNELDSSVQPWCFLVDIDPCFLGSQTTHPGCGAKMAPWMFRASRIWLTDRTTYWWSKMGRMLPAARTKKCKRSSNTNMFPRFWLWNEESSFDSMVSGEDLTLPKKRSATDALVSTPVKKRVPLAPATKGARLPFKQPSNKVESMLDPTRFLTASGVNETIMEMCEDLLEVCCLLNGIEFSCTSYSLAKT